MTDKEKSLLQKDIINRILPKESGRLILAPRIGKTRIIIELIKRDKYKSILWVTPNVDLRDKDIPEEFIKWKAKKYLNNLKVITWKSLIKEEGYYELIVLDEEQAITENNSNSILNNKLTYNTILSMTGTKTKHSYKKEIYELLNLKILVNLSIAEASEIGALANYNIFVIKVPISTHRDILAGNSKKRFLTSEEEQYNYITKQMKIAIFNDSKDKEFRIIQRLQAIKNSPSKEKIAIEILKYLTGKIIIFASTIKQAELLCNNSYHSKTDDKDMIKFQNNEIDRISMVNSGSIGFAYKNIDHLLVIQADSDNNGITSQRISRTLLFQKNYIANIYILCLMGTQDEVWVRKTLSNFNEEKIRELHAIDFLKLLKNDK